MNGVNQHAKRLTIRKINKSFGPVHVVHDLDLVVEPGEFLVLLGPSGCGKTTALRMVAGLEETSSGEILIGDTNVTTMLPKYRSTCRNAARIPHASSGDRNRLDRTLAGGV